MPAVHGKAATLSVDDVGGTPRSLSEFVQDITLDFDVDTDETTGVGATSDYKTHVSGFKGANLSVNLAWDATIDGYLFGVAGTPGTFSFSPNGTIVYSGEWILSSYGVQAGTGGKVTASISGVATGVISRA